MPKLPKDLFQKIMRRIEMETRLAAIRRRLALFSILLAGALATFFPALSLAKAEMARSGFMEFFSLIFSDSREVLASWKSFGFALLESFPLLSMIALLATIFAFLQILKFFARDIKLLTFNKSL